MSKLRFLLTALIFIPLAVSAQEICNNGIDDDGDLLIDLNDTTDCTCDVVGLGNSAGASIIPNPSFEDMLCCPQNYSDLNCADTWEQATTATSDYFHTCGFWSTAMPTPMPPNSGQGVAGAWFLENWKESVGGCLLSPMLTGTSYTLGMDVAGMCLTGGPQSGTPVANVFPAVDVTIYGLASCPTWPLPTTDCPVGLGGWVELGHYTYTITNQWQYVTITFVPTFDVEAIVIGPPCTWPSPTWPTSGGSPRPYFFFDNLTLNNTAFFQGAGFAQAGSICNTNLEITAQLDTVVGSYQWFQDGVAIVGQTDTILPFGALGLAPDTFQFQQTINVDSCVITEIIVEPPVFPDVQFSAFPLGGCVPLTVSFDNMTDSAMIGTSTWDMGNGTLLNAIDTSYTYTQPGSYDITLTIVSPDGCSHDTTFANYINVDALPTVVFTSDTTGGCEPTSITFSNLTPNATACSWDFGNGTTSVICNPTATYLNPGTYDVSLTVTSPQGCVGDSTAVGMITIHPTPEPDFVGAPLTGCVPVVANFSNNTLNTPISSCLWDFGDGGSSNDCNPQYSYNTPGTYDVTLSVVSDFGCVADTTFNAYVTTYGYPDPSFTADPVVGCWPLEVDFQTTNVNGFNVSNIQWDFGDGNGAQMTLDPNNTYGAAGIYDVSMSVTDLNGCTSDTTLFQLIEVLEHPTAGFTFTPEMANVYDPIISFFNAASSDVINWQWQFIGTYPMNDVFTPSPVVVFPEAGRGDYTVYQIVTNANGCIDTAIANVNIAGAYNQFVPNAFTPNGDGFNDIFVPVVDNVDPDQYEFYVFNRWGEQIFFSNVPLEGWDGTAGGSLVPIGTYVWKLVTRNAESFGDKESQFGHVTVIR